MKSLFSQHGFELSDEEFKKFEHFLKLFMQYNAHTNLSAIRDEQGIVEKHFIDSLYGAILLQQRMTEDSVQGNPRTYRLLDIGSGGGFPGIPLKIVLPELQVTLLDSVGKKVKAMNHFVSELGLENIIAIQERAEVLAKVSEHTGKYDFVVSRATAYITDILSWASPFVSSGGYIILYKMPSDEEKRDREKISKKLGLKLMHEEEYELAEKKRILSVFQKK